MELKRTISILGLLFASISCMIGSGWLFGAFYAARIAGPAAVVSWGIGAVMIILIAFVFSELSTALPLSGGIARYSQFTHGTLVSFSNSWLAWLSCVAVAPTEVQAILQYSTEYFPWLTHQVNHVALLTWPGYLVAALMLLGFTWLNCMGVKKLTSANNFLGWWKILVPLGVAALIFHTDFHIENFTQLGNFAPTGWKGILHALPAAVIFSYLGFREATSLAGEVEKPHIAIPIAVIGSVLICGIIYVFIQTVFIGAIHPGMVSDGWAHLHFPGDAGPFAGIASILGLSWLASIIYADASLSPTGTSLIYTATTARINMAMTHNGYLPKCFAKLNKHGVPANALLFNYLAGLVIFFPFPGWQALIKFQSLAIVLAYGTGPISVLALREQAPDLKRPFRLKAVTLQCYLTLTICNLIGLWTGWDIIWRLMVALGIGWLLLLAYRRFISHLPLELPSAWWLLPYFGGLSVLSYLSSFGGLGVLPFGWDLFATAIFSAIILKIASQARLDDAACQTQLLSEGLL